MTGNRIRYWALTTALVATSTWGEVYRWEDAQGHAQFGDRAPAGVAAEVHPLDVAEPTAEMDSDRYSIEQQVIRMEQGRVRHRPPPRWKEPEPMEFEPEPFGGPQPYWGPTPYWPALPPHPPARPMPRPSWRWVPGTEPPPRKPYPSGRVNLPEGLR